MRRRTILYAVVALLGVAGGAAAVVWAVLQRQPAETEKPPLSTAPIPELQAVSLSDETVSSFGLDPRPVKLEAYPRTLEVPGTVIERPGLGDYNVPTPITGVVARVLAVPGDIVRPGDPLFTIRLVSESVQSVQRELYQTAVNVRLNREQIARLQQARDSVPEGRFFETEQQLKRLEATLSALRSDLLAKGLSAEQVASVEAGTFIREITVQVPPPPADHPALVSAEGSTPAPFTYEVQTLRAELGDQVMSGQVLVELANHQALFIEGRVFDSEAGLVAAAADSGEPIAVDFPGTDPTAWPKATPTFVIRSLGNLVDPASRTVPFFVPLENQSKTYMRDGKPFLIWRYRPGQRVRLRLPVETLTDVFVLPIGAVVRDGAESFVYRRSGDTFQRRPVRILYEDRHNVVIAKDSGINAGQYVVRNNAAAVERARKAAQAKLASGGAKPGGHWHADGSYHEGRHD